MVPLRLYSRKNGDTVNHDPVRADVEFVSEGVTHLRECDTGHVRDHFELKRSDIVAILLSQSFVACNKRGKDVVRMWELRIYSRISQSAASSSASSISSSSRNISSRLVGTS